MPGIVEKSVETVEKLGEKSERKRPERFCGNGSGLGEMGEIIII